MNRANDDFDGICAQLTFLELFLHFSYHKNPFHRAVKLRPLTGNGKSKRAKKETKKTVKQKPQNQN